jgi:PHD/YefM family antitoxin component YafN of YafNO toxin-antitoxin module
MSQFNERYVINGKGERVSVILDISEYQKVLEELEELEAIRAYDAAKAARDEAIPFEQAINEIKRERK